MTAKRVALSELDGKWILESSDDGERLTVPLDEHAKVGSRPFMLKGPPEPFVERLEVTMRLHGVKVHADGALPASVASLVETINKSAGTLDSWRSFVTSVAAISTEPQPRGPSNARVTQEVLSMLVAPTNKRSSDQISGNNPDSAASLAHSEVQPKAAPRTTEERLTVLRMKEHALCLHSISEFFAGGGGDILELQSRLGFEAPLFLRAFVDWLRNNQDFQLVSVPSFKF